MTDSEKNWQKFAKLAQNYNSKYLTKEDRIQMVKDIYLLEKGEIEGDFQEEYKQIGDKLSALVLGLDKQFSWKDFVSNFANRKNEQEITDIVARDLLMIQQIQKMYEMIVNGKIDEKYESENKLEMEAFRLAHYLYFKEKYKNYIV